MAENGYLSVRAYTSNAQIPVEGVTIAVTLITSGGESQLLTTRITDDSGRIDPIPIPAPNISESREPGTEHPWTSFNLTADHPNYERILVENLQIFAGVTTDQELKMIPLSEYPERRNMTEIFNISEQPL